MNLARTGVKPIGLLIFLGTFVVALSVQSYLWMTFPVADMVFWAPDAEKIARGSLLGPALLPTSLHPGVPQIFPMAGLVWFGLDSKTAVSVTMAVTAALCIALIATISYRLWSGHLWWLATALMFTLDIRLLHATPPSTSAALLSVLLVYLFLYAKERTTKEHVAPLFYLGIGAGTLLLTRIEVGLFLLLIAVPTLILTFRVRALIVLSVAGALYFGLNAYLWADPTSHIESILAQIRISSEWVGRAVFVDFLRTFPFALLSIVLSVVVVVRQRFRPTASEWSIPVWVYAWLLGATIIFTAILIPRTFHPLRYFMPFYVAWDALLPLWLSLLIEPFLSKLRLTWLTGRGLEWIIIGAIALVGIVNFTLFLMADTQEVIW